MRKLLESCRKAICEVGAINQRILVACSGGADSMALLYALETIVGQDHLIVAHFNHMLRGEESDGDRRFVAQYCQSRNLRCIIKSSDVRVQAEGEGENLEATGRRMRYEWLIEAAREHNTNFIATGHHADDQAETVLFHLMRGSGLRGLRGIAPVRTLADGILLIRPLLRSTGEQILNLVEARGIGYREDSTNYDVGYSRNRIRHELLPRLSQEFDASIKSHLADVADHAREVYEWLERTAREAMARLEKPRAEDTLVFARDSVADYPPVVLREGLRLIWEREGWPMGEMKADAWDRLAGLFRGKGTAHEFPGGVRARIVGQALCLFKV